MPPVPPDLQDEIIDWAEISQSSGRTTALIEQTRARLSPEGSDRFRELFLNFIWSNPPLVTEAQTTLHSIFASDPLLLARYSSFLSHPASTLEERDAARAEFGRLLEMPMVSIPRRIPGWTMDELCVAIKERLGRSAFDRFIHLCAEAPRASAAGRATRPDLVEQLQGDKELVQRLDRIWPKEGGDFW